MLFLLHLQLQLLPLLQKHEKMAFIIINNKAKGSSIIKIGIKSINNIKNMHHIIIFTPIKLDEIKKIMKII